MHMRAGNNAQYCTCIIMYQEGFIALLPCRFRATLHELGMSMRQLGFLVRLQPCEPELAM